MNTKPHIYYLHGVWLCGAIFTWPWYIDWVSGNTPVEAYENWKRAARS